MPEYRLHRAEIRDGKVELPEGAIPFAEQEGTGFLSEVHIRHYREILYLMEIKKKERAGTTTGQQTA